MPKEWVFVENGFSEEGVMTIGGRRAKHYVVVENVQDGRREYILKKDIKHYLGKIKSPKGAFSEVSDDFYGVFA